MVMVGTEIAKMHLADIIHGDLTTSNMMLRHPVSIRHSAGIQQLVHRYLSLSK
jgi:TP53 regulating kinase and related kinases